MINKEIFTLDLNITPTRPPAHDHYAVRLAEYASNAKGAYASATERARRADLSDFVEWCIAQGREALPATPETVKNYIGHLDTLGRAISTIERRLQSITHMHKAAKTPDIPTKSDAVRLTLRRIKRRLADAGQKRGRGQAAPLTFDLVGLLIKACDDDAARVIHHPDRRGYISALRDKAMIALAYSTLMRRGELVALNMSDIDLARGVLTIRKSKTDQDGAGAQAGIEEVTQQHLIRYLHRAGHSDGPVFRSNNGTRLDGRDVARIIQRRAKQAGLSPDQVAALSAHSTRVGAAVDAASAGRSLVQVQRDGRWKSANMVARYTEAVDAQKDATERAAQIRAKYTE